MVCVISENAIHINPDGSIIQNGQEMVRGTWRDMAFAYAEHLAKAQGRLRTIAELAAEGGSDLHSAALLTQIQEIAEKSV